MKDIIELLNKFITDKKVDFLKTEYWDKTKEQGYGFGGGWKGIERGIWSKVGPYSYEEAFIFRPFLANEHEKLAPKFIPVQFHNKKINVGDFEITIQHETQIKHQDEDKDKGYNSSKYRRVYHNINNQWNIILKYHGCYLLLGKLKSDYTIKGNFCLPTCTNWGLKSTVEKPYVLEEAHMKYYYEYWDKLEELFKLLQASNLNLEDSTIPFQDWYDFNQRERNTKNILELTLEEKDVEWLIRSETKDGIYKPEKPTIDRLLFSGPSYEQKISKNLNKKLLSEIGIHTVQFRSDSHYNIPSFFDLKGIKIKAPQKVIEKYSLEKYCIDDKMVEEIKEKQRKAAEDQKKWEANNKFTLMQHGKIIFDTKDKEKIIEYLENFSPTCKDIEDDIIDCVKPIFDNFPKVEILYIAYWGRYYKYELSGEVCEIKYCSDNYRHENTYNSEYISEEDWEQIVSLYDENLCPSLDDRMVENKWGWPDRGGIIMGVKKNEKGKLEVFTEDYDFE